MVKPFKFIQYSKSSSEYRHLKKRLFEDNKSLLDDEIRAAQQYKQGIHRINCKICSMPLAEGIDFSNHSIPYKICSNCDHLNGAFDESDELLKYLYNNQENTSQDYSLNYATDDFAERANEIYAPKIDFLSNFIGDAKKSILDIGCGAGHFVFEALKKGYDASGIDLGSKSVEFGNSQITNVYGRSALTCVSEDDTLDAVLNYNGSIISAMGVIEHMKNPIDLLKAFNMSSCQYLYFSVPMFSLSVYFENIFRNVAPRLLSIAGGHTHLFSMKSYDFFTKIAEGDVIAEWRFGTDMMDLFRSLDLELSANEGSSAVRAYLENNFIELIDDLQSTLDNGSFFSEIHTLIKKF